MLKHRKSLTAVENMDTIVFRSTDVIISNSADSLAERKEGKSGMNFYVAAFFLVAQMAGAGFLALPKAVSDAGWTGLPLLIVFCVSVAFSGTRLGHCWVILEERWEEYKEPARQPYMEIAYRAYGKPGRIITMAAVLITLIGSSIVYIILIAQFLKSLIPQLSFCAFVLIVGLVLIPFTWPGTPNDFWQASVLSVVSTFLSCFVIFIQLLMDKDTFPEPRYDNPSFVSFSLGFGAILFSFGGASVFPTIQNDMADRSQFWKSVIMAFAVLLTMYFPVASTGYILLGSDAPDNILLYAEDDMSILVKVAIALEIINLFVTYLIACNPICQIFEELFNVPRSFGWKRCVLRTSLVLVELLVGLSFPDFGLILNLVGGSTVTMCSFLFPPLYFMKLVKDSSKNKDWPQRSISTWQKCFLWGIFILGIIGGICATGSAIMGIVTTPLGYSCFSQFSSESF